MPQFENTAEINATLGLLDIDQSSTVTVLLQDVWFEKTADKETWDSGPLTYTINVRNEGDPAIIPPEPDLTGIVITDNIDIAISTLDTSSITFDPAGAGTFQYNSATGLLEFTLNDIAPGDHVAITFRVERNL